MVPSRWGRIAAYLSLGLALTCVAAGAQLSFSTPKNISMNSDFSVTPQVAVDAAGNINVVWEDDTASNSNIVFSRSIDGGVTFSTPKNVFMSSGFPFNPRIAVDGGGAINVVWVDNDPSTNSWDIFFSRSADGGTTFSAPLNLSNDTPDSGNPQLAVDTSGNIYVVWENENTPYGVFFTHSTDGGTSFHGSTPSTPPLNLATASNGSFEPQIAIDGNGNINVAWEDDIPRLSGTGLQSDVFFARSTDNGTSFAVPTNLSKNDGNSFGAQLAVDATGNINVVWVDNTPTNSQIFFSRSVDKGANFSPSTSVANISGTSDNPKIAVDGSGNIHVVWQHNTPTVFPHEILFARSSDGGASFVPQNLSNNSGNSTFPWLTVDSAGNVNVSWKDTTPGNADIFFTQSVDAGATFFSPPQNLSAGPDNLSSPGSSSDVQIAADNKGNLNVFWSDDTPGVDQIFFSRFAVPLKANQPPVANAGPDQTLQCAGPAGTPVTLDGSASSDPDGDALTFQWKDENNNVVGNSAIVSLTLAKGVYTFTLTVTDPGGLSSSAVTHVTIPNRPPVANAGPDQTLQSAGPAGTPARLDGSASSDPDGDTLTFQWKDENNNVVGNSAIVSLTLAKGVYTFTLTVTDPGGLSSSAVTHVTIPNRPPVANAGPDQTLQSAGPAGTLVRLDGSASSDPDGDTLTFQWKDENNNVVGNSAIVSLTLAKGLHTFTLTVTDPGGLSSSAVTHVTIPNRPPVANAGSDQTLQSAGPAGTPVTLDGSASSDPDGDALTFQWKDENNNVVGNSAIVSLTLAKGLHTFTLTVTDPGGLSSSAVTHVTIPNRPPVANAGPDQTLQSAGPAGTPVRLDGSASSDPDGDALTFQWKDENNNVVGNSAIVPLTLTIGVHTFTLTVTDPGGLSSSAVTHVTVVKVNRQPVANAGPDQTLQSAGPTATPVRIAGPAGTPVRLDGSASSDPDGDTLTFQWKDEANNVVGNSAIVSLTLTIGVHTFTLTVTDSGGLSSTAVTHVTIVKVNRPPVANAGPDQTLQCAGPTGMPVTLDGFASSDPDGDALSFIWTDENNRVVGNSAVAQVAVFTLGTHTFMLKVTDTGGLSSTASTHVTIGDTKPPTLSFSLSPNALFPPNHKLVLVTATVTASDACDAHPSVKLVSITSTDPSAGRDADIQAAGGGPVAFGTDVRSFQLRSENSDQGGELVYTVTYSASDASGNVTSASAQVPVGHNYVFGPVRTNPLKKGDTGKHSDDGKGRRKKGR